MRPLDLSVRRRAPELMDALDLERARRLGALDALERVNRVSLTAARVWAEVRALGEEGVRPVRVLDVACGGGDVLVEIARRARRHGLEDELLGCDVSDVALERARARAGGLADVRFIALDVLRDGLPRSHHVTCSSLFLHHLADADAVAVLRRVAAATERVLLVQDLRRSRAGYVLAWVGLRMLTTSDVALADGPSSVRAAYTVSELRGLAAAAGLEGAEVRVAWPERVILRWARP